MQKISTLIVALMLVLAGHAQENKEEVQIKNTIERFFEGLHKGDSSIVAKTLYKEIKIQTTFTDKSGVKQLKTQSRTSLLRAIASKKPKDVYFEKLLRYDIKIDGNLAAVWTPYEFYFNGKFSHCGANSFQLFNNNGRWEIIYLVDMRKRQGCQSNDN
jgi:hypothetical protein